ncbi:alpha/beta fold hydrolase [Anthocerotibacter panamensis]|uniref:alpha/beta fold hydrolase n=1 Tax=Anthocerotibacter panamensis TaxID=2857077 RepID=UPI001C404F08|nr:alpha/beta fold hydrolase [Anthocerotibacter panamensis]
MTAPQDKVDWMHRYEIFTQNNALGRFARDSGNRLCLLPLLATVFALTACTTNTTTARQSPELKDCSLAAPGSPQRITARCGTLTVFENREAKSGRTIALHFAVLPAISRNPKPDALVFLPGGPGQTATEAFPALAPVFERINQDRDIVLVDQRGTGQSNPLRCPEVEEKGQAVAALVERCVRALKADLTRYTTSIAMADLDEVRQALGYPILNLYGGSYGTRSALVYLHQYPNRVRAVILDGVAPPNWSLGESVAQDAQRALDLIFERCEHDTACRKAFPQLRREFEQLLVRLDQKPTRVTIAEPTTGSPTPITINRQTLATTVRTISYFPEAVALLPLLLHTTYQTGDTHLLGTQGVLFTGQFSESISNGLFNSVVCAEDVPFFTPKTLERERTGTYLGVLATQGLMDSCRPWPRGRIPADFKDPVMSKAPVLILSGEADPVTPPANGALAARTLPNSLQLVAPGQGHIVVGRGCIPRIATEFIKKASVNGLSTTCLKDLQPIPFFITFAGPKP